MHLRRGEGERPRRGAAGASGSEMVKRAQAIGLPVANEVFADRGYRPDGTPCCPRNPGA